MGNYNYLCSSLYIHKKKGKEEKVSDNLLKDYLLSSGKYELWRNNLYAENSKRIVLLYGTGIDIYLKYQEYLGYDLHLSKHEQKMCERIYNANKQRNKRLRLYIDLALTGYDCVFLTLTFKPKVLENTSHSTRREYISEFCKNLGGSFYCANIDYGDKDKNPHSKGREHYHALVNLPRIDIDSYPYGWIRVDRVRKSSNPLVLAKYINKLTNHAYKDSTKGRDRVIYSRKKFF